MKNQRRGPYSESEKDYINTYVKTLPYQEIAANLRRNPKAIRKYIEENLNISYKTEGDKMPSFIDQKVITAELKSQFSTEELNLFKYNWNRIYEQFRDDVLPTEELQIMEICRIEILLNRLLRDTADVIAEIARCQKDLELAHKNKDTSEIHYYDQRLISLYAGKTSCTQEYDKLLTKKERQLKDLKGTREQRMKKLEDSKENFSEWIKRLIMDRQYREQLGVYIEKMRIATDIEQHRLSEWHSYVNKELDQPFLNTDTLKKE